MNTSGWTITQHQYVKEHNSFYETLFTLSNGYIGIRNTLEFESYHSIPGTFFANVFDNGLAVPTEIVNAPSWLPIRFVIDGKLLNFDLADILDFNRTLDLAKGEVRVSLRVIDKQGQITQLNWAAIVHMETYHLGLVWGSLIPENYTAEVEIQSYIDYRAGNAYLGGFLPQVQTKHCVPIKRDGNVQQGIFVEVSTLASNIHVAEATQLFINLAPSMYDHQIVYERERVGETIKFEAELGKTYEFTKFASFCTSMEFVNVERECRNHLVEAIKTDRPVLTRQHYLTWQSHWDIYDVRIEGDLLAQESIRFGLFHLIQSVHPKKNGTNIAARGLSSEYHSGHFFFNTELYKLPFFSYLDPATARSLLMFRYNTLSQAKQQAKDTGCHGAKYPEEADNFGRQVAAWEIVNIITGEKAYEWSGKEVKHLSADVAYSIYRYVQVTGDLDFLLKYGLEILIETAQYGVSLLEWDKLKQAFVISSVMGMDEYHYHIDNHYFTNYMVKWNIEYTLQALKMCDEINSEQVAQTINITGLSKQEIFSWKHLADMIYLLPSQDMVYEQHEGYFQLPDQRVQEFDTNKRPILADVDLTQTKLLQNFDTKLIKQADIVMLIAMFWDRFSLEEQQINFDYYEPRTMHESSLSATPHALVASRIGRLEKAYSFFLQSARYNLDFIPKEDYRNGLHLASYAGAWQIIIHGFAGVCPDGGVLEVSPQLPKTWSSVTFKLFWQMNLLQFTIYQDQSVYIHVLQHGDRKSDLNIKIGADLITLDRDTVTYRTDSY